MFHKTLTVLGKCGVVKTLFNNIHIKKPSEKKVVVKLFAELPLASYGIERYKQHGFKHPLRRDGGASCRGIHLNQIQKKDEKAHYQP